MRYRGINQLISFSVRHEHKNNPNSSFRNNNPKFLNQNHKFESNQFSVQFLNNHPDIKWFEDEHRELRISSFFFFLHACSRFLSVSLSSLWWKWVILSESYLFVFGKRYIQIWILIHSLFLLVSNRRNQRSLLRRSSLWNSIKWKRFFSNCNRREIKSVRVMKLIDMLCFELFHVWSVSMIYWKDLHKNIMFDDQNSSTWATRDDLVDELHFHVDVNRIDQR